MADMMAADELAAWKAEHPGVPVVTYVNSTAEVKALTDICCTSANARAGRRVARSRATGPLRAGPQPRLVGRPRAAGCRDHPVGGLLLRPRRCDGRAGPRRHSERHPSAQVMAHPECRAEVVDMADAVLSTSQMLRYAADSDADEFIVVTEEGLLHALSKAAPGKRFVNLTPEMVCRNMKVTTIEKVRDSLAEMKTDIDVPADVRDGSLARSRADGGCWLTRSDTTSSAGVSRRGRPIRAHRAIRKHPSSPSSSASATCSSSTPTSCAQHTCDVLVIGSGIAGLTTALAAVSGPHRRAGHQGAASGEQHVVRAGRHRRCGGRGRLGRAASGRHDRGGPGPLRRGCRAGCRRRGGRRACRSPVARRALRHRGRRGDVSRARADTLCRASCTRATRPVRRCRTR